MNIECLSRMQQNFLSGHIAFVNIYNVLGKIENEKKLFVVCGVHYFTLFLQVVPKKILRFYFQWQMHNKAIFHNVKAFLKPW